MQEMAGTPVGRRVAVGDPADPLVGTVEGWIVVEGFDPPALCVRLDRTASIEGLMKDESRQVVTGDYVVVAVSHEGCDWTTEQLVRAEIWPIKPTTESFASRVGAYFAPHAYFSWMT